MVSDKPLRSTFHQRLEYMVEFLREHIVTGRYEIGELLPSNAELCKRFGLSKNSVRKGLDLLGEQGLIIRVPKVGAKVAEHPGLRVTTIKLGCYNHMARQAALQEILEVFHATYPHIRVLTIPLPFNPYFENVKSYMDNEMLDVMMINHNDFDFFCEESGAELLEELESRTGLYPFIAEAFSYKERLLALPFIFSPTMLCYNKAHFAKIGMTEPNSNWTWDDLMKAAAKLTQHEENYGFYYHMQSSNRWPVMLLQSGFSIDESDHEGRHARESFARSIELCRKLIVNQPYSPHHFSESDSDVEELFMRGKVSMIISTYYNLNKLRDSNVEYDVAPLPRIQEPKSLLLTTGLAINARSKEKHASRMLLDFMLSYEAQLMIRKQTLTIPSLQRAAEWRGTETINRPSRFHMYREIMPTLRFMKEMNLHNEDIIRIRKELMLYWAGMEDSDSVCVRLEDVFKRGIREHA